MKMDQDGPITIAISNNSKGEKLDNQALAPLEAELWVVVLNGIVPSAHCEMRVVQSIVPLVAVPGGQPM